MKDEIQSKYRGLVKVCVSLKIYILGLVLLGCINSTAQNTPILYEGIKAKEIDGHDILNSTILRNDGCRPNFSVNPITTVENNIKIKEMSKGFSWARKCNQQFFGKLSQYSKAIFNKWCAKKFDLWMHLIKLFKLSPFNQ